MVAVTAWLLAWYNCSLNWSGMQRTGHHSFLEPKSIATAFVVARIESALKPVHPWFCIGQFRKCSNTKASTVCHQRAKKDLVVRHAKHSLYRQAVALQHGRIC